MSVRPDASTKLAAAAPRSRSTRVIASVSIAAVLALVAIVAALVVRDHDHLAVPKNGAADGHGVVLYADKAKANVPRVDLYEDFQCPLCKQLNSAGGASIHADAQDGKIKLVVHMMTFLDDKAPTSKYNHSSARAANAFYCAMDSGRGEDYYTTLFARQGDEKNGQGFPDDMLRSIGSSMGSSFSSCQMKDTYNRYVKLSDDAADDEGIAGTPTVKINGKSISDADLDVLMASSGSWHQVLANYRAA